MIVQPALLLNNRITIEMPFKKGQSGNPKGRPPNERSLATLMTRALSRTIQVDDRRRGRKYVMAELLAQAVATGKVKFPDGHVYELDAKEWMRVVERVLMHIDGPVPAEANVNLDGNVTLIWDPLRPENSKR